MDLTARSMANNVIISGIYGEMANPQQNQGEATTTEALSKENCKEKVLGFMRQKLRMEVQDNEVIVAHRIGKQQNSKPRPIVMRCEQELRERIFSYTKNLKDQENQNGDPYYVHQQLPEPLQTAKKEREDRLRSIRKANEQIPEEDKHRRTQAYICNNMLFINKVPQKKFITPPTVQDIFSCDRETNTRIENLNIVH